MQQSDAAEQPATAIEAPSSYLERARLLVEEHAELFRDDSRPWRPRVVAARTAVPAPAHRGSPKRSRQLSLSLRPQIVPGQPPRIRA